MNTPSTRVRNYVTAILRELHDCTDHEEREDIAREINRLNDGGGVRLELADMAQKALKGTKQ